MNRSENRHILVIKMKLYNNDLNPQNSLRQFWLLTMTSNALAFKISLQSRVKTDICNSSCNEISEEGNNTVSFILTITPKSLVYPLEKNMENKENYPKDKEMSDIVWLLHLSVMISSLALKGQELYIITSGLVRRVPDVEGPVALHLHCSQSCSGKRRWST